MIALVRNAGWRAAGIGVDLLRIAITMPLVARALGASDYGRWSAAVSTVAVFMASIGTGLNDALVRVLARAPRREGALLRAGTRLRLVVACAAAPTIIAITGLVADRRAALAAALMTVGLFAEALATRAVLLTVHLADRRRLLPRALIAVASTAATVTVVALGGRLLALATLTACQGAVAAWLMVRVARPLSAEVRADLGPPPALWPEAWPMIVVCSLEVLYLQLDVLMVSALLDSSTAGALGAATRFAYLPLLVMGALTASALPEMSRRSGAAARALAWTLARRTGLVGLGVPLALGAGAPVVVAALGADYAPLRWLMPALGLRVAIAAFTGPLGTCALATGRQRGNALVSAFMVAILALALAVVIPRWGLPGAVAVVVLAEPLKGLLLHRLLELAPAAPAHPEPEPIPCT